MSVVVLNGPALKRALERAAARMRADGVEAAKLLMAEAMVQVSETVPVDSGRLSAAYSDAAAQLGYPGGNTTGLVAGDAEVKVDPERGVVVTIHTPHARFIEEGTAAIAPGLQVVTAMEKVRRRLIYGRGPRSLTGQMVAAWNEHIAGGG